ncbi:uncharacterized protein ASPGLDRAFT_40952 [Aspergillus glaucus CBS 516.65]|uniref:Pentatricopeptide repeat domain-containing protein n=1 Tax=Aspergillus glaucus CBS 516.65 TaxID=1160497 RepID=A0A1L9VYV7_ASPGL|nr:hypothetical protein ASPGLDRAFT_40952 [Aspergillus glaucus CBS 516.65]OJJ89037.1 hypothetical protein ASPGLDRAFT_40952 [Aspergillus glaucus CBS 516.65]
MRPALVRLLKRPSAVSVLDSLVATPLGIEHLELNYKRLRCQNRTISQNTGLNGPELESEPSTESPAAQRQKSNRQPFSFRVHEIGSSCKRTDDDIPHSKTYPNATATAQDHPRSLALQPERLEFESDIGHTRDIGAKLVDDPARRHDFALWEELLRHRQRHYGDKGTLDIWEGLTVRHDEIELPVDGKHADFIWESFIELGLRRGLLLQEIVTYASELWRKAGKRWGRFYLKVVGGLLERGRVQQAVTWHENLQHPHLSNPNDILQLLEPAISLGPHPMVNEGAIAPGIRAFRQICHRTQARHIYGPVISRLLQSGLGREALWMHVFFVSHDEHPRKFEDIQKLLQYAMEHTPTHIYQKLETYAMNVFESRHVESDNRNTITAEERVENFVVEEKPFSDEIGARLFATRSFNLDMILSGLRMLGVTAIGPQSLREMAVRAHGSQDLLEKLRLLQKSGISVGDSVFARLIRRLAEEKRDILLSDLLHSDQHPDVLEDATMQESLLMSYYMTRDWRHYQMTLAILTELSEEGPELFNVHFRKQIVAGHLKSAAKVVDTMTLRGRTLTKDSLNLLVRKALGPRRPGVGPPVRFGLHPSKEVLVVFQMLKRAVPKGCHVDADLWVEILKRFGMTHRWYELRDCCLWLARFYSSLAKPPGNEPWPIPPDQQKARIAAPPAHYGSDMLKAIFSSQMQSAIVSWGFRCRVSLSEAKAYNPFKVKGEQLVPWVRGLVLLRELEQYGVRLARYWIRRTCRHRLAVLFGRDRLSSRPRNRMLRRENPYDVHKVTQDMNRAWGSDTLFRGWEMRDLHRLVNPPSTKMSLIRTRRTVWRATYLRNGAFARTR